VSSHTVTSLSSTIFQKFSFLTAGQQDDISASLEELEKRYGSDFFDLPITLQGVIRLVGNKFVFFQGPAEEMIAEKKSASDVAWAEKALEEVKIKISDLKDLQSSFPNYPETGLDVLEERKLCVKISNQSFLGRIVILSGGTLGDLILTDPSVIYYLFGRVT
jgi:hypothetical protein